ncbi:MAG: LmbE family protein [Bacteroidetes bacterium]|nr:MAG: LmbE family protein [Bacteroidota bacterium]
MLYRYSIVLFILLMPALALRAQAPKKQTSADIHLAIKKLNVLGSALYLAAHPDDENTRLIAWLSNDKKINTAYLSLTRGDGGQNLIGTEIRELLGVLRTQELLAARRVDGGNQMFSRANDFGYSKHPDETLKIWNKEEVLADVVWAIRKWHPDVIINRFDHRRAGKTHGHHTSSALLSVEAFDLAADPTAFPEQLRYVNVWKPRRLFYNTSWWRYGGREAFAKVDKSNMVSVDVGVYYPLLGKSNNEIAAESRSMHKCQGFGSIGSRGSQQEYMEIVKGDLPKDRGDLFEGIDVSWNRLPGGAPIGRLIEKVDAEFDDTNPGASVPDLVRAMNMIKALPDDGYWKQVKLGEIKKVIEACMGLYLEAVAGDYSATPGQAVELSMEIVNRSPVRAILKSARYLPNEVDTTLNLTLENNQVYRFYKTLTLPENAPYTNAYWLNEKGTLGMYRVDDQTLRGLPETPRVLKVAFDFEIEGTPMTIVKEVVHKRRDRVKGEVYRPFEITPPVFANIETDAFIFANNAPQTVSVMLKAGAPDLSGTVELCHPENWRVEPEKTDFQLTLKGEEKLVRFTLYPPENQEEGFISPIVRMGDKSYTKKLVTIEYDHIPTQTLVLNSEAKVVKIDLKKAGERVGYVMGAGDKIPESLRQIGYEVTLLEDHDLTPENLQSFDAVILGIRAYNTNDRLRFRQKALFDYVQNGGTLITQYITTGGLTLPSAEIGPYPFKLSHDRVSVEEAEVRFLKPDHPVLNFPNKITQKDFEGWVQERGLYFPNEWDPHYEAILSSNDPGESPKDGGLLVAKYGKGYYIYTGYSWFRELPAGVPGAYRIFANMISIGKSEKP